MTYFDGVLSGLQAVGLVLALGIPALAVVVRKSGRWAWGAWTVEVSVGALLLGGILYVEGSDQPQHLADFVTAGLLVDGAVLCACVYFGHDLTYDLSLLLVGTPWFAWTLYWASVVFTTQPRIVFAGGTGEMTIQGLPVPEIVLGFVALEATALARHLEGGARWLWTRLSRFMPPVEAPPTTPTRLTKAGLILWVASLPSFVYFQQPVGCAPEGCYAWGVGFPFLPLGLLLDAGTVLIVVAAAFTVLEGHRKESRWAKNLWPSRPKKRPVRATRVKIPRS